jgi:hypothetical protein
MSELMDTFADQLIELESRLKKGLQMGKQMTNVQRNSAQSMQRK